ncbi:ATP-dependent DNA ligase [Streptomyces xanthophaeus]
MFTPTAPDRTLLLQTRRGALIQDRFPDLFAAADQLPDGLVLDGELVVWDTKAGQLAFEGLQRRTAARSRRSTRALAASLPAFFIAFDVLQQDGRELTGYPYCQRRVRLEALVADHRLASPWTLRPMTTDLIKAQQWLESWTEIADVEGIVVKTMNQLYQPGEGHDPSDTGVVEDDEPAIGAGRGPMEGHGYGDRAFSAHRAPGVETRACDDTSGQCPGPVIGGWNGAEDAVEFDCQGAIRAVHSPVSKPSGSVFIGRRGIPMVIHSRMLWWVIRWPVPLPLASRF